VTGTFEGKRSESVPAFGPSDTSLFRGASGDAKSFESGDVGGITGIFVDEKPGSTLTFELDDKLSSRGASAVKTPD
jgi:hypothetical protein